MLLSLLLCASAQLPGDTKPPRDTFGDHIAGGADLDGDGVADLFVSAQAEGNGRGVRLLALSGARGVTLRRIGGAEDLPAINAMELVPDHNGDRVADVALVLGSVRNHELIVCSGADGSVLLRRAPPARADRVLRALCDADGDGRPELVYLEQGERNELHVRSWLDDGIDRVLPLPKELAGARDSFRDGSYSVAVLADLDRDGAHDFVLGAPFGSSVSVVFVLSGKAGNVLQRVEGAKPGFTDRDWLGTDVQGLGDFDGDGVADFLATNCGAVAFYSGPSYVRVLSGSSGAELYSYGKDPEPPGGVLFGACGDLDHDGRDELLLAGRGDSKRSAEVRLVSGPGRATLRTWGEKDLAGKLVKSAQAPVDFDGDGVRDVLIAFEGATQGEASLRAYSTKSGELLREFVQLPE